MKRKKEKKKRFYQKGWFLCLCTIFIPPVGIILLWSVNKTMKKRTKIVLSILFSLWFIILVGASNSDTTNIENDKIQVEQTEEIKEQENVQEQQDVGPYGWTKEDYTEFAVALNAIANNYLTDFKLPHYTEWQFAMFDDYRIIAMTDQMTFKGSHDKHTVICVFVVTEGGTAAWSYFATDEKVYFDDGSCNEVFEKVNSLVQQ